MLKKIISLTGVLALTISLFTGCGSTQSSSSESENGGDAVTLKYYTIGSEPRDKTMVLEEVNKYLVEKINAKLDMTFIDYGDYTQKMSVIINSGENYDLAFTAAWAGDYLGNARKGAFLDLTPYLDTIGKDMYEAIDKRFWEGSEIDGKNYAVPNQKEISTMPMWVFTKEYVDKYNIPYQDLHTLEDLEPWLKLIKENEPNVVPLYITQGFSTPQYFDTIIEPIGVELGDETLTVKNVFETEKAKSTLQTLREYYKLGYINADSATAQDDKSVKRFITKGDGQPYAEILWGKDLGYEVVATPIMESLVTNASTTGSMIAVSNQSKNKEKAVEFLNLLNTDEYLRNLLNYGIEGVHYTRVNDDQIKLDPEKSKNYSVGYYTLGNLFITDVLDNEPITKWEEFKQFNDAAENSPILGFKFDTAPVSNQLAAINNVVEEFKRIIFSGSVDIDEYLTKFNNKLKEQGLDKVIEEAQRQLNEWVSAQ